MLKRRRFNKPAVAVPALPPPAPPAPAPPPEAPANLAAPAAPPSPPPPPPPSPPPPPPPPPPPLHCGRCDNDGHTDDTCDWFPEAALAHADARLGAPPLFGELEVHEEGPLVVINGTAFQRGRASGAGCNCLIDTLRQHLGIPADLPDVRRRLRMLFQVEPTIVTASNFLDFRAHAPAIIRIIANAVRRGADPMDTSIFRLVCVDLDRLEHGDCVGTGDVTLYIAREDGNHFIPLHEV